MSSKKRPGEDVHDSVLPTSHWQAWKIWEIPKEIEAKGAKARVIWFVDRTQWCSTSWISILYAKEAALKGTLPEGLWNLPAAP